MPLYGANRNPIGLIGIVKDSFKFDWDSYAFHSLGYFIREITYQQGDFLAKSTPLQTPDYELLLKG